MRTTKLLTIFLLSFLVSITQVRGQCSLITKNGSSQDPKTVCAPVDFTMNVWFKFLMPVDTSLVVIRFVWNDGTGAITTVPGNWNAAGDSVWAEATHIYPPDDECAKTADSYLVYDGDICTSSGHQEQTFSTWGTDEENSGVLNTDPVVYYFCEGDDIVDVTFDDASTFNCNIAIEPDNPNRYFRWVQFIYNTYIQPGDRIPDVTVRDGGGMVHVMTDNAGNFVASLNGPIIQIPIPADGPNQTSFAISAPPGGVAGDIFEITLRNWNVCNPYDNFPTDGIPPADLLNGDNPPIITTAYIEIIAPPPVVVSSLFEFCTMDDIQLTATAGSAEVRWYADSLMSTLLHIGNNYNPQLPPFNLDNTVPGNYTFWVTSIEGMCESAPSRVDVVIYETPDAVFAGDDQIICADSIQLSATPPSAGTGLWTTSGSAGIDNPSNPVTWVHHLDHGPNTFRWTVTNGPCNSYDEVIIISDRQPDPAYAGIDNSFCDADTILLDAAPPTDMGRGHWLVIEGSGTISDTALYNAEYSSPSPGTNLLIWRVSSQYGACPISIDSIEYFVDYSPGIAFAGNDIRYCEVTSVYLEGNTPINGGSGNWVSIEGSTSIDNVTDPNSRVDNLVEGDNSYIWTLSSAYGLCPSTSDTVTISLDLTPGIADAGPDIYLCLENSDTLDANSPIRGEGHWQVISNPSGTPPVFSPNSSDPNAIITVLPGNEGEYTIHWILQNGSCISIDTLIVDFGIPPPPSFAGNDTSVCGLSVELHANTFQQGTGMWTQLTGPGTASFDPDRYTEDVVVTIPSGSEGVYDFEWMLTSGACAPTSDTVQITFLVLPDPPIVTDAESCGPDSLNLTVTGPGGNAVVQWYYEMADPGPFHYGDSYTTPYLLSSEDYYVNSYDSVSHCRSSKLEINANIYPVPDPPILQDDSLCGPGDFILTGTILPPAHVIRWSEDALETAIIGEGTQVTHYFSANDRVYARAVDTLHGCISDMDSLDITVHPAVPAPTVYSDSSCGPSDFYLHATGQSSSSLLYWHDDPVGGSIIQIADSLYVPSSGSSSMYWVSEFDDSTGCSSERVPVEAIIHPIPATPVVDDTSSCGAASFVIRPQGDINTTTFRWYDLPVGGTIIQQSDTLYTGLLSSNEFYWVSGYNEVTSCESPRDEITISIYPMPAPINIIGPTVVLLDQTGVIFSTTGNSTSTYVWTIPVGITLDENMNDFIRLSFPNTGSYTISVYEITQDGCIGNPVSHPINVINDSIAVDIGLYNQNACTAVDFEIRPYLFGGTPPYTYSWTGDIAYLSNPNSLFTTFSPPGTGTYYLYLEVVDVNLKTAYDSVAITVFTSPTANITIKDEIVCVGDELQIQVETTGYDPVYHLWTGPVHNLSSYSIMEPVYTPYQPDTVTYYYELTDVNGCKAYDSTNIYSDIPIAYFELLTEPGCSPLLVEFNNLSERAVYYEWEFGDSSYSTIENPSHTFINQSAEIKYYPVRLEVTSILGCKDDITQYAMVWPNPEATLDAIPENACSPADITLFSTPGNMNYYWDFDDGVTTSTNTFDVNHMFQTEGEADEVFHVKVITESSLHCIDSAFLTLNIYASPEADFAILPPSDTFPNNSFELNNLTEGSRWDYRWNLGDEERILDVRDPGIVEYESPGNYTVSLAVSSEHCADSVNRTLYLHPAVPHAKFAGPEPGCMPHTITLINNSQYAEEYYWEFGDGSISTAAEPTYTYYQAGIYKIKLTVKGPGGEDSYSDTARVYIIPNAFFDLAPRYVYVNDEPVNFFNLSDHGDIYEWDFGDGTTSTEFSPKHVYREEGTYDITLMVTTDKNCIDLYVMENAVFVEPSGKIEYPNAFRPNSPLEENRVFLPGIIDHVAEYHLMIFNRWGEMVFESHHQDIGWDGTYNGKPAKQDVYIWKVKGTYSDGKGFTKTGDVTLMY